MSRIEDAITDAIHDAIEEKLEEKLGETIDKAIDAIDLDGKISDAINDFDFNDAIENAIDIDDITSRVDDNIDFRELAHRVADEINVEDDVEEAVRPLKRRIEDLEMTVATLVTAIQGFSPLIRLDIEDIKAKAVLEYKSKLIQDLHPAVVVQPLQNGRPSGEPEVTPMGGA